jgi:hypothetical protein
LGKPAHRKNKFNPLIFFSLLTAIVLFGMQPKKLKRNENSNQVAAVQVPVFLTEEEFVKKNLIVQEKEIVIRSSLHRKQIKKSKVKPELPQSIPENESLVEPQPAINAFYTENKIKRDYSNQLATGTNQAPILSLPGTPYLPTVMLSYQAVPEIIWQDSIMNLAIQNGLQYLITSNRIKTIASLATMESEIEKNRKQLKEIELKNRKFILLDQRKIKPLLEEINHQIKLKKQQINNLKVRLQISEEEIIHI